MTRFGIILQQYNNCGIIISRHFFGKDFSVVSYAIFLNLFAFFGAQRVPTAAALALFSLQKKTGFLKNPTGAFPKPLGEPFRDPVAAWTDSLAFWRPISSFRDRFSLPSAWRFPFYNVQIFQLTFVRVRFGVYRSASILSQWFSFLCSRTCD